LNSLPATVATLAPEQARFLLAMPPPMWICAAVERWQRAIASDEPASL
jgi:hypothetical protein